MNCIKCGKSETEGRFYIKSSICHKCYMKDYKIKHKDKITQYHKDYAKKHKTEINANARKRRQQNPNVFRIYNHTYYAAHKEECIKRNNLYSKIKKEQDPLFRFQLGIRHNIYLALTSRTKHSKSKPLKTEKVLGCSLDDFKEYISSMFQDGMSWDNYGEWHLDHIIPLASANTQEEVIGLCHYTNYQPLWAEDNYRKGGNI